MEDFATALGVGTEDEIVVNQHSLESIIDESPQAYKNVDEIIDSVTGAGLAQVVAKCKPLVAVKGAKIMTINEKQTDPTQASIPMTNNMIPEFEWKGTPSIQGSIRGISEALHQRYGVEYKLYASSDRTMNTGSYSGKTCKMAVTKWNW